MRRVLTVSVLAALGVVAVPATASSTVHELNQAACAAENANRSTEFPPGLTPAFLGDEKDVGSAQSDFRPLLASGVVVVGPSGPVFVTTKPQFNENSIAPGSATGESNCRNLRTP